MNTNIFKAFLICMIAGVAAAVACGLVLVVTNALNATDFTNDQISAFCGDSFGIGFVAMVVYCLVTKRQW